MQQRIRLAAHVAAAMMLGVLLLPTSFGQEPPGAQSIRRFLQAYLAATPAAVLYEEGSAFRAGLFFSFDHADLDGDATAEVLIYVSGPRWCGTGGCSLLIAKPAQCSYELVDKFHPMRLPVHVLPEETNRWKNLAMTWGGGGVYLQTRMMVFNGRHYEDPGALFLGQEPPDDLIYIPGRARKLALKELELPIYPDGAKQTRMDDGCPVS